MIVTVYVGYATSRPPAAHRYSRVIVSAASELEGELIACQMVACRAGTVMPVSSEIVGVVL